MKKLACLAVFAMGAFAGEWTGVISDAACGAKHADASEKSAACVKACVGKGQAPVLVTDGKVVKVAEASKPKVMEHLGHKVKVTGNLEGDTVTITEISMAQ